MTAGAVVASQVDQCYQFVGSVQEISLFIDQHPAALKVCHISVVAHIEVFNEPSLGFVLFQVHFRCLHQCS